jgi:hypothetical protein
MNKEALFQELREQKIKLILELKENVRNAHSTVDLDEIDTIDPEDLSHQHEGAELQQLFEEQLNRAEEDLLTLKHMDTTQKVEVLPGAVVFTKDFNFIVGIPALPFQFENTQFVGISMNSAIYTQMKGKHVGEEFKHAENKYTINQII